MKSLKYRIMIPVFLLSTIGIVILSFLGYGQAKKIIINYAELATEDKVDKLVVIIDNMVNTWDEQIEFLSKLDESKKLDYNSFFEYVNNEEFLDKYEVVFLSDIKGDFIASNGSKGNITDRAYFYNALEGKSSISILDSSKYTGNPVVLISYPIDNNGKIVGVVGATVNLFEISSIINEEKLGSSGYGFIINSKGLTIAHPRKEFLIKTTLSQSKSESFHKVIKKMIAGESGIGYYEFEGVKKIISFKPINSTDWIIGMTANYDEVNRSVSRLRNYILLIGSIIVALISILLYFLTDSLVKPINKLKNCMEIASKGDLTVRSDIASEDEIGVLSNSFNKLVQENKRLLDEVVKYDNLKTDFFSNISHELKTPLNIIFSSTQLLYLCISEEAENYNMKRLSKYIDMIKQNSYRLLRLVNNLIDITRIDSGFMELDLKNLNIVEVVENITQSTVEYVKSKSRCIVFDTDVEEKIMAFDPEKMERIILNLISNAVKFTREGDKIEVSIYDKSEKVKISVKDTGIGIPKEKQEKIFGKFIQINPLYNRRQEGSGIGLSLVKSLVDMHGGKIYIESDIDKGTEFIIELPVKYICEEDKLNLSKKYTHSANVEKIEIEFSDIYD